MSHGLGVFDSYRILGATGARYYCSPNNGVALTLSTLVANTMYLMPFITPIGVEITALNINIGTAVASSTIEVGLYADTGNAAPGQLLVDWGSMSGASTGSISMTGLTTQLPPGLYWIAFNPSGAIHVEGFTTNNMLPLLGSAVGISAAATNATAYTASHTAGALPSTPGTLTIVTSPPFPYVGLLLTGK